MMLLSLVLTIRPRRAATLPSALGRAAHAALLRAVDAAQPQLAQSLHEESGPRPFTCSSILGKRPEGSVSPDMTYALRYTALGADLADLLPGLFPTGAEIELDGIPFTVEAATTDAAAHPWAGRVSYEDLSAPWLLGRRAPGPRIAIRLASPTVWKSAGKAQPFPLPDLVFGSLLDRWNAHAPVALPQEVRRFAAECMAVSRYELRTHAAPFKTEGSVKLGAVGTVTYAALNHDRYWLSVINLLADFAFYSGLGAQTALGMGQARRIAEEDTGRGKRSG